MKAWSADGKRTVEITSPGNIETWEIGPDHWTPQEDNDLCEMIKFGMARKDIAVHLGRTVTAITSRVHILRNHAS